MVQLLADVGKMKTRCKHILDVTDRYCVLSDQDLNIIEETGVGQIEVEESSSSSSDRDSPDGGLRLEAQGLSPAPGSSSSSPITQHLVKSTFESFGSHLAVIAKTYTRKRGHSSSQVIVYNFEMLFEIRKCKVLNSSNSH